MDFENVTGRCDKIPVQWHKDHERVLQDLQPTFETGSFVYSLQNLLIITGIFSLGIVQLTMMQLRGMTYWTIQSMTWKPWNASHLSWTSSNSWEHSFPNKYQIFTNLREWVEETLTIMLKKPLASKATPDPIAQPISGFNLFHNEWCDRTITSSCYYVSCENLEPWRHAQPTVNRNKSYSCQSYQQNKSLIRGENKQNSLTKATTCRFASIARVCLKMIRGMVALGPTFAFEGWTTRFLRLTKNRKKNLLTAACTRTGFCASALTVEKSDVWKCMWECTVKTRKSTHQSHIPSEVVIGSISDAVNFLWRTRISYAAPSTCSSAVCVIFALIFFNSTAVVSSQTWIARPFSIKKSLR